MYLFLGDALSHLSLSLSLSFNIYLFFYFHACFWRLKLSSGS